ncbi:hypothetical protein ONZ45_g16075 [Pleurotus djamor]|nr:hypothetical protein ONZ45_g16075 [Pleurotus djamor]
MLSMAQYSPCPWETIANYGQCAGACFSAFVSPFANTLSIKGLAGVVRPTIALKDTIVFGTIQTIPSAYPTLTQLTRYVHHLINAVLVLNANAPNSGTSVEVSFSRDLRTVNMGIIASTETNSSRSAGQRIHPALAAIAFVGNGFLVLPLLLRICTANAVVKAGLGLLNALKGLHVSESTLSSTSVYSCRTLSPCGVNVEVTSGLDTQTVPTEPTAIT